MKRMFLILVVIIGLMLMITSCSEDKPTEPRGTVATDLLSKVVVSEFWDGEIREVTVNLVYDQNKRLTELREEQEENTFITKFFFDNDDKVERIERYRNGESRYSTFLTWSGSTVTAVNSSDTNRRMVYHYSNNSLSRVEYHRFYDDYDEWVTMFYRVFTWQGSNLAKVSEWRREEGHRLGENVEVRKRDSLFFRLTDQFSKDRDNRYRKRISQNGEYYEYVTIHYEYDNKNNPFNNYHHHLFIHDQPDDEVFIFGIFVSRNNLTHFSQHYHEYGEQGSALLEYEYNNRNYPTKMELFDTMDDERRLEMTWQFYYITD